MKRVEFVKHLTAHYCILLREGRNHSVFMNEKNKKQSAVPRHRELSDMLCKKICKQLEITDIKKSK